MATQLSQEDKKLLYNLQHDFDGELQKYREKKKKEFSEGKKGDLEQEYKNIQAYIDGCMKGEIPDVLINIQFAQAKIGVLETILRKRK